MISVHCLDSRTLSPIESSWITLSSRMNRGQTGVLKCAMRSAWLLWCGACQEDRAMSHKYVISARSWSIMNTISRGSRECDAVHLSSMKSRAQSNAIQGRITPWLWRRHWFAVMHQNVVRSVRYCYCCGSEENYGTHKIHDCQEMQGSAQVQAHWRHICRRYEWLRGSVIRMK